MIMDDMKTLAEFTEKIRARNRESVILSDISEAADDWRILGKLIVNRDQWTNLRELSFDNEQQHNAIMAAYAKEIAANPDYAAIMACGARMIAAGKLILGDPRGYLGYKDLIEDNFAFLVKDYGFIRSDTPTDLGYARGGIKVRINSLPCRDEDLVGFVSLDDPHRVYGLSDIRFMLDPKAPLEAGPAPVIETEAEAKAAYAAMAALLRRDCGDILAGVPGAFERLVAAAAERDRLFCEMMDRLHGTERRDGAGRAGDGG